jgi:putative restriction endonuclease
MAYVGMARVADMVPDHARPNFYYVHFEDFIPFDIAVPWRVRGLHLETPLRQFQPQAGLGWHLKGKSVRELLDADFDLIVSAGLSDLDAVAKHELIAAGIEIARGQLPEADDEDVERAVVPVLRKIRLAAFRESVRSAYGQRCAITRLRITDAANRPEVQAAHIHTVEDGGPDVIPNGIALSGTIHWLFDRHLISISEDYRLLVTERLIPPQIMALIAPSLNGIHLPEVAANWPQERFLARHRTKFHRITRRDP